MTAIDETPRVSDQAVRGRYPELQRLISNAVCDERFAAALIADPAAALSYSGYATRLSGAEQNLLASVRGAQNLAEFAARLHQRLDHGSHAVARVESW
jgi:hypothetical protein